MTAKIELAEGDGEACVKVAGRLEESAARELVDLCRDREGPLLIDVEEVVSLDRASAEMLRDLRTRGARVVGASPYILMLLNGSPGALDAATCSKKEEE
jgi:hypothetical protein